MNDGDAFASGKVVVKRYANRKLYDTASRRYASLDDLADLIRAGMDVQVVDHASGEDLTAQFLVQIILADEKSTGGVLPLELMRRFIQAGSDALQPLHETVLLALGAPQLVDAEIRRRIHALREQGLLEEPESLRWLDLLLARHQQERSSHPPAPPQDLPTQADMQHLMQQLDALHARLSSIARRNSGTN